MHPSNLKNDIYESYAPNEKERYFIDKIYQDFILARNLKENRQTILSNRTLQEFWDDGNKDYVQYLVEDDDDWIKTYPSGMVRDKANIFIANIVRKPIIPQVIAQNKNQIIDKTVARVLKALLEYAITNDGKPESSGHKKQVNLVHKQINEGTAHRLIMINENKDIETELVPNEEIFIKTFWQSELQKQPMLQRVKQNILYEEAKLRFGHLKNFKYVVPGNNWQYTAPVFKELIDGVSEDNVIISWVWYPVPKEKLSQGRKIEKYFNIVINGVLMFEPENKDIYNHGFYPMQKIIFEILDSHYYWGNSIGNKIRHDKKFADSIRTLLIAAEKLDIMPPYAAEDGLILDEDIMIPGKITSIQGKADQLKRIGERRQVTQGDVAILDMVNKSADEGSSSPILGGNPSRNARTLGEIQLQEANASKILSAFGLQTAFGVEGEGYLMLKNIIQFYPRKKINNIAKISIPNQKLIDGKNGTMEVLFKDIKNLSNEERDKLAREAKMEEVKAKVNGESKEVKYIDPNYANELTLFINIIGNPVDRKSEAMIKYEAIQNYEQILLNNPNIDQVEATKVTLRELDLDENLVIDSPESNQLPKSSPEGIPQQKQTSVQSVFTRPPV